MSDKNTRILIAIIGLILIFSIFLPHFLKSDKPHERLSITVTEGHEKTSVSTKSSTRIKISDITTSSAHKTTDRSTINSAATKAHVKNTNSPLYLDINTASFDELQQLKGIGPVIAQGIIDFRNENERFNNIDELLLVSGIGDAVFADIRAQVYVVDPVWPDTDEPSEPSSEEITEPVPDDDILLDDPHISEDISTETTTEIFPVNINTADRDTLMLIPGIDEDIADEIIYVRENIGGFVNVNELLLVKDLSRSHISEIQDLLCF